MDYEQTIRAFVPRTEEQAQQQEMILWYLGRNREDVLTRENLAAHLTSSAMILNPRRDKALMVYHNIYQSWSWTGGHADGDGDLLAVALREAREETAVQRVSPVLERPLSAEILTVPAHWKRGAYVAAHLHLNVTYLLEADDRQPLAVKPDENSGVRWFPLDEAVAASTEPEMRIVYQKLNGKLRTLRS